MGKYYDSNAHKEAFKRELRVREYSKLLNKVEEEMSKFNNYRKRVNLEDLTTLELQRYKKMEGKNQNNLNMARFYQKKINRNRY